MERTPERVEAEIALLGKATATLAEILAEPLTVIVRDATIQRFEYTFEVAWKAMQVAAEYMGNLCHSPREAIKIALRQVTR